MAEQNLEQAQEQEQSVQEAQAAPQKKKKEKKKRRKIRHPFLKAFGLLLLLAVLGIGGFVGFTALRQQYTVTYQGYRAYAGSITDTLEYSSKVQLIDTSFVTAESAGKVRTVYVAEGDTVKEGQRLLRLSTGETVTSPIDGTVNSISVKADDEVKAGDMLVQVADFSRLQILFSFSEYDVPDVQVGTQCQVTVTATSQVLTAAVTSIDYTSTSRGSIAYYTGKLVLEEIPDGLLPGMQVTVNVSKTLAENTVVLSTDALSFDDTNQAYVYLQQEDGSMTEQQVSLGEKNDDYVQITAGLADGDVVYVKQEAESVTATSLLSGIMSSLGGGGASQPTTNRGNGSGWSGGGNGGGWSGGSGGGGMPSGGGGGGMPSGGGGMR